MELRHLRYFLSVAETLNFSRAAERLHIAQPALSKQIRNLEELIGAQLFTRSKHQVALTRAGEAFREQAILILEQTKRASHLARRVDSGEIGRLSIGFVGSASYSFLPWVLRAFHQQYPDVELTLREMDGPTQAISLRDGRIDIGFLRLPVTDKDIAFETIFQERFILALPSGHRLATQDLVSMYDLSEEQFIMFPERGGSGFRIQITDACQGFGFLPRIAQEAAPMQNVIGLVGAGLGISIVPESVQKIQMPEVVYRPLLEELPTAAIALAWHKKDTFNTIRIFSDVAREVARSRSTTSAGNQP
ncbi:LysR family transcriptional regulator [Paralcaligenes sp. KSB-10]|uniref:LysR family transcriptional regulator n=1 Tax=Paralcaligenes sp. KSB-10 TaxID=2901142 RepID=UPI001E609A91|nr:LysR family transcriptional regulator [Paralcaligenes sp. KSB-10]UHL64085.1 LysR family transcriptional regulator [Paralcaligenes sp. KSB-10]